MKSKEILKSLMAEFFHYLRDEEAVIEIRKAIKFREGFNLHWEEIKNIVEKRAFDRGEALRLIQEDANLPLHENTDDEAYNWFEWLIKNVEAESEIDIIDYASYPPFDSNNINLL
jgi:hypothetical protein